MNSWYNRYYVQSEKPDKSPAPLDYSFSNMIYDQMKGVSGAFIPLGDDSSRFVSDSEIAYSTDPSITSRFSAQHRQMVANSLMSQPRSPAPVGKRPTDDQLLANGGIRPLERDEAMRAMKANARAFSQDLRRASLEFDDKHNSITPSPSPSASPSSSVEPQST